LQAFGLVTILASVFMINMVKNRKNKNDSNELTGSTKVKLAHPVPLPKVETQKLIEIEL
jgi:hypothetical protein